MKWPDLDGITRWFSLLDAQQVFALPGTTPQLSAALVVALVAGLGAAQGCTRLRRMLEFDFRQVIRLAHPWARRTSLGATGLLLLALGLYLSAGVLAGTAVYRPQAQLLEHAFAFTQHWPWVALQQPALGVLALAVVLQVVSVGLFKPGQAALRRHALLKTQEALQSFNDAAVEATPPKRSIVRYF